MQSVDSLQGKGGRPVIVTHAQHSNAAVLIGYPFRGEPGDILRDADALRDGLLTKTATSHDLRRTAAKLMGRLDIDQVTIGRVLNRASTTKATVRGSVYDRYSYVVQKRRALQTLDAELTAIFSGRSMPLNVVKVSETER